MSSQTNLAETFYNSLPLRPYAANDVSYGLRHYRREDAAKRRYLQHNPPHLLNHLVFDIDRPGAYGCWEDANLPTPNIWAGNPANGHGQAFYRVATPVCTGRNARPAPLRLADAVYDAFNDKLGGDPGYTGLISKNPLAGHWRTAWLHDYAYPLLALADHVDLTRCTDNETIGVGGRNTTLFTELRLWAYGAINGYQRYEAWSAAVMAQAVRLNTFSPALPYSEVKATAKSVAKWVFNHHGSFIHKVNRGRDGHGRTRHDAFDINTKQYRPSGIEKLDEAVVKQHRQLGARNTNAGRTVAVRSKIEAGLLALREQSGIALPSLRQIAKVSGVSLGSVSNYYPEIIQFNPSKVA